MAFDGSMGYTPSLDGFSLAVVNRVVHSIRFMVILMFLWCPPPCGVERVSALAYRRGII